MVRETSKCQQFFCSNCGHQPALNDGGVIDSTIRCVDRWRRLFPGADNLKMVKTNV
jgi:hypothetical protein